MVKVIKVGQKTLNFIIQKGETFVGFKGARSCRDLYGQKTASGLELDQAELLVPGQV